MLTSHLSAGPLHLIIRNFSSQYCAYHITALWGKCHKNTISLVWRHSDAERGKEVRRLWLYCSTFFFWTFSDLPLRVERTPQCPRYHLHELLCLSWGCKLSFLDEFHSLGKLSDLWRHTFRMIEQTDPILHFLSWRQLILGVSDYPGSVQPSLLKTREEDDASESQNSRQLI